MDCFTLLDEPRLPWLDAAALKEKFLARSAQTHPDKFPEPAGKAAAQVRFTDLNNAHNTLAEPKRRLSHLLFLERGKKPPEVHDIPQETADLFLEVGELLRLVDAFLAECDQQTSPLLKAQAMPEALRWLDQVEALQKSLNAKLKALNAELQSLNVIWQNEKPLDSLERIYHQFSYLTRWRGQLQDRAFRLGL